MTGGKPPKEVMRDYDAFATYDDWRRWRQGAWPRPAEPPRRQPTCTLCGGGGWVALPDPFFNGALVDQRCPYCQDTTIRAHTSRWEDNQGKTVGPK